MTPDNMAEAPLHSVEFLQTTPHVAARRMRVPGGWLYWVEGAGTPCAAFVPDPRAAEGN